MRYKGFIFDLDTTTASVLGLREFDENVFAGQISEIHVPAFNHLVYVFKDGSTVERVWQDKSRRDSWTPEMREQAAANARKDNTSKSRTGTPPVARASS